jgi:hypothetical protein
MTPTLLTTVGCEQDFHASVAKLVAAPTEYPFSNAAVEFCAELSQALFRAGMKDRPEVHALAYWCRSSEVTRLKSSFAELATDQTILAPRGTVFHIPPVNVETLFLYGWLYSILCGNRNVVRISSRSSSLTTELCAIVGEVLSRHAELARINMAIRYGHDDQLTAELSASCDVRIVWGGDETVRALRRVPMVPTARDICFPDRYSYSIIAAAVYIASSEEQKRVLARAFYNDCYWFDQMACSSPRLIAWCGSDDESQAASKIFYNLLASEVAAHQYSTEAAMHSNRLLYSSGLIVDQAVDGYETYGTELAVLRLNNLSTLVREHCGGGLLLSVNVPELSSLKEIVQRRDQTLTYYGFDHQQIQEFAHVLNGCGIDRIVPIGQALTFNRYWDGYDLLQELTRRIWVQ